MTGAPGADSQGQDASESDAAEAEELGRSIRNLLDPYTPPPDPYVRVVRRIRARHAQRMVLAGLASAAAATVIVIAIVASGVVAPGDGTTVAPAGPGRPVPVEQEQEQASGPQFAQFGDQSPLGPAYVVASGTVHSRRYVVASVSFGSPGRVCLYADDGVFAQLSQCFTADAGQPGAWAPLDGVRSEAGVRAIGGIVTARVDTVTVSVADGRKLPVRAVRTPTSPDMAFFVLVLPGPSHITAVVAGDGRGPWVTLPNAGADSCQDTTRSSGDPGSVGCATAPGDAPS
jgi:hypothetical protein